MYCIIHSTIGESERCILFSFFFDDYLDWFILRRRMYDIVNQILHNNEIQNITFEIPYRFSLVIIPRTLTVVKLLLTLHSEKHRSKEHHNPHPTPINNDSISHILPQQSMLIPSLSPNLNLHTLQHPPFQIPISNIHTIERTMCSIKIKRLHRSPNL